MLDKLDQHYDKTWWFCLMKGISFILKMSVKLKNNVFCIVEKNKINFC